MPYEGDGSPACIVYPVAFLVHGGFIPLGFSLSRGFDAPGRTLFPVTKPELKWFEGE
jgi:hypothetical protein